MSKRYRKWKMYNKGKMKTSFREYRRLRRSIQKLVKKEYRFRSMIYSLPIHIKNDWFNMAKFISRKEKECP